jgi:hypothetical protein
MTALTMAFPESLEVSGKQYKIDSSYRTVLECNGILNEDPDLSEKNLIRMLTIFYREGPTDVWTEEFVDQMFWFFACGREQEKKRFPKKIAGVNGKKPFDFTKDADLIYAAFMQEYGIDLNEQDMHWWKFMILLENISADTRLAKVIEYRTIDVNNKNLTKEEAKFYKAMQSYYGLESQKKVSEKVRMIEEALLNGGDVSKILEGDWN